MIVIYLYVIEWDGILCIYVKRYQSEIVKAKSDTEGKYVFKLTKIGIPKYIKFLRKVNKKCLVRI